MTASGDQVVHRVPEHLGVDVQLLVVARVHEMERAAVLVEVLHLPLVEHRPLDVVLRAELVVAEARRPDVAQLRLDEPALVAGREMLQVEDAAEVRAHLDQHSAFESCRLN